MAEREGFEPSVRFPVHTLSRRAPSTTRSSLQVDENKLFLILPAHEVLIVMQLRVLLY